MAKMNQRNKNLIFVFVRGAAVVLPQLALAANGVVIPGDQSTSLLHEVPVPFDSGEESLIAPPQINPRDELISLLGNVEMFVKPPEQNQLQLTVTPILKPEAIQQSRPKITTEEKDKIPQTGDSR